MYFLENRRRMIISLAGGNGNATRKKNIVLNVKKKTSNEGTYNGNLTDNGSTNDK